MHKIKIGCLLPVSGVMPSMAKDFKKGLETGLAVLNIPGLEIEVIPELTNQGQIQNTYEAINKLSNYHDADLLTGIVSDLVVRELVDTINTKRLPFIYNNLGEYVPSLKLKSPFLFHNSLHLWKSQWAMGKKAQEQFGGTPAICFSVYDAGYHLHEAFRLGTVAAGAPTAQMNMLPLLPNQVDTSPLIQLIEEQQPDHVHAILCGVDGKDFIRRYHEAGLADKIPLTACPFLVEDEVPPKDDYNIQNIQNCISWSYRLESERNSKFIEIYEKNHMKKPSAFSVLGYESGLAIIHAVQAVMAKGVAMEEALKGVVTEGPRGRISFGLTTSEESADVYLRIPDDQRANNIVTKLKSVNPEAPEMAAVAEDGVSGWQNPYLCI